MLFRGRDFEESAWTPRKAISLKLYSRFVQQADRLAISNLQSLHITKHRMSAKPLRDRDRGVRHQVQWRIAQLAHLRAPTASGSVDRPLSVALQWQNGCETTPAAAIAACRSEGGRAAAVRKASNVETERRGQGAPKIWLIIH